MAATAVTQPVVMEGALVRLVPLEPEHEAGLMAISSSFPEEYVYTSTPVDESQARAYFATAYAERDAGRALPFAVFRKADGRLIGSTRLADIRWQHRNCELGYTWFHPDVHRTGVNVDSKLLMLTLAFERLELVRVQIHTDSRNLRSQRAIEALGATREGVLRRHMINKDGFIRDTVVYSVTDQDWPAVERLLRGRLARRGVEPVARLASSAEGETTGSREGSPRGPGDR